MKNCCPPCHLAMGGSLFPLKFLVSQHEISSHLEGILFTKQSTIIIFQIIFVQKNSKNKWLLLSVTIVQEGACTIPCEPHCNILALVANLFFKASQPINDKSMLGITSGSQISFLQGTPFFLASNSFLGGIYLKKILTRPHYPYLFILQHSDCRTLLQGNLLLCRLLYIHKFDAKIQLDAICLNTKGFSFHQQRHGFKNCLSTSRKTFSKFLHPYVHSREIFSI